MRIFFREGSSFASLRMTGTGEAPKVTRQRPGWWISFFVPHLLSKRKVRAFFVIPSDASASPSGDADGKQFFSPHLLSKRKVRAFFVIPRNSSASPSGDADLEFGYFLI